MKNLERHAEVSHCTCIEEKETWEKSRLSYMGAYRWGGLCFLFGLTFLNVTHSAEVQEHQCWISGWRCYED